MRGSGFAAIASGEFRVLNPRWCLPCDQGGRRSAYLRTGAKPIPRCRATWD